MASMAELKKLLEDAHKKLELLIERSEAHYRAAEARTDSGLALWEKSPVSLLILVAMLVAAVWLGTLL